MAPTTPWWQVDGNTNTFPGWDGTEKTSFCPTGRGRSIHLSLFSKQENTDDYGHEMEKKLERKNHTTRLSPLSFFPVSFRYETISGHTPTMLLTTSRRPGRERLPVSMALRRDCLDCIQSRCSAPFNLATMNSVIEKGSNVPNTTDAVFCRHRFNNLASKTG